MVSKGADHSADSKLRTGDIEVALLHGAKNVNDALWKLRHAIQISEQADHSASSKLRTGDIEVALLHGAKTTMHYKNYATPYKYPKRQTILTALNYGQATLKLHSYMEQETLTMYYGNYTPYKYLKRQTILPVLSYRQTTPKLRQLHI